MIVGVDIKRKESPVEEVVVKYDRKYSITPPEERFVSIALAPCEFDSKSAMVNFSHNANVWSCSKLEAMYEALKIYLGK